MEKRDTLLELVSASGSENNLFWREYLRVNSTRTIAVAFASYFEQTRIAQGLDLAGKTIDCSFDHSPTEMAPKVKKLVKDNALQIIDETEYRIQFCKIMANVPLMAGSVKWTHSDVKLVVDGDADEIDAFTEKFEALFFNDGIEVGHVQGFKETGFPSIPAFRLRDLESQIGKNHYYPWLEEQGYTLKSFAEAFKASNKNVLLLIGDPGTGKSTFRRPRSSSSGRRKRSRRSTSGPAWSMCRTSSCRTATGRTTTGSTSWWAARTTRNRLRGTRSAYSIVRSLP